MKVKNLKLKIWAALVLVLVFAAPIWAQDTIRSDNYEITWPNVNMGSGKPTSTNFKLGVTTGQNAPGLYTSTGFKVRAGFQYIHSIIPFTFKLSALALAFGTLDPEVLTNEKQLTLTVNSGSAGGYQVLAAENNPLTSAATTIPDVTCDPADTCTQTDAGTWTTATTYGFGYTMTGTDVPTEFSGGKFKNFPSLAGAESPVKIMGKTPADVPPHEAEKNKVATLTARINIANIQAAGNYQNILTFTAIPTY
ncbi:hypothetical protein COT65_01320 [Candidatus Shapirobacteria bacterium CG09_land_8_20_14_0_10_47_13]|uniref:Uncharacterized protein n=1 Tax=Candidatus Shapirobacteria bacterium CG09_land_8_20_14_0_10_47_13 TaxID=1974481 RepID=A0A2H0WMW3_9BACT|nr:MAG: hypothetical protein COT65_01320 [Candidatus Shapirobacteria bacterium CG09_land_8_20_14_0_10_47_13]